MKTTGRRMSVAMAAVIIFQAAFPCAAFGAGDSNSSPGMGAFFLPEGRVGADYEFEIQTSGGLAPLTRKLVEGEVPPGIELSDSGKLKGTPTIARREAYSFKLEVSDSSQPPQRLAQPFLLMIQAAPLRVVMTPGKLKIVSPETGSAAAPASDEGLRSSSMATGNGAAQNPGNDGGGNGAASLARTSSVQDTPVDYEPGYIRSYFSGGAIFSKEPEDFSKQDIFMGFNVEKNWVLSKKFNLNTYVDVRLTSIPVNAQETPKETEGEGMGEGEAATPDTLDTFLASKKAALLQFGLFFPILAKTDKNSKGEWNSKFIAPIFKAGIQTITSGFETSEAKSFGRDDVFNFGAAGVRLGYQKFSGPDSISPEMGYLDITRGKWENFEVLLPVKDAEGKQVMVRERRWRWGFEGRLMIPRTPLMVGFDANVGDGADDVRFIFGTRFDIGKLFKKLSLPSND